MEQIRQKLACRKDFDIGKAFLTLAAVQRAEESSGNSVKYVCRGDLDKLMKKHDHFESLQPDDISLLLSRFDLDNDGRIGINEFYHQLEP